MGRAKGRFCIGVLGLVLWSACREAPPPVQAGVDVQHYRLHLKLDPATLHIDGHARLRLDRPAAPTELRLYLAGLTVDSVRAAHRPTAFRRNGEVLYVALPGSASTAEVDVWYHGIPDRGLHRQTVYQRPVVFTDTWPEDARGWLPAVDHPSDPATFTLTLNVPHGYSAVANGVLEARDSLATGRRTTWHLAAPAPTYAFALAVADYRVVHTTLGDTLPIQYYLLPPDAHQARHLGRVPEALAFFSDLIGPYPYANFALAQVPIRHAGMENAALPFLRADLFLQRPDRLVQVAVHETAHQWFGNRVVLQDWRDLWLSEGMATYLTLLFFAQTEGPTAARQRKVALVREGLRANVAGAPLVADAPPSPEALLTEVPYRKGAAVLHLLHLKMGDAAFRAALRRLYSQYAGRPLSTEAARAVFEETAGLDLEDVFRYWVYGHRVPTLHARWAPQTRTLHWEVRGDGGTLAGVPFEIEVHQGANRRYVPAAQGRATFEDWTARRPRLMPVGLLLNVDME